MAVNEELLKKVLEEIRPNLQADGGDMEYMGVDDEGVVKLELQGACAGCPMSALTLSMGVDEVGLVLSEDKTHKCSAADFPQCPFIKFVFCHGSVIIGRCGKHR